MHTQISFSEARELILKDIQPCGTEPIPLAECFGRVLAQDITAIENIPPFDRSPYDGYAFRAEDTLSASLEFPVSLEILEEVPAGSMWTIPVTAGTCTKVLTGSPIPDGADTVIMFEKTEYTEKTIKIFSPQKAGSNIVHTGEDIVKGTVLAEAGTEIDAGTLGTLASQNIPAPLVYQQPRIGILSTGSELIPVGQPLLPGKIYDSNLYTLSAAVTKIGCIPVLYGIVKDNAEAISIALKRALQECDAVITTGGVSVGDYDLTPDAMEICGAEILFRGVAIKPGMACAYAVKSGKLICGLSGNPASSLTNFYAVALPALQKLCGKTTYFPNEIEVVLKNDFHKKSPCTRFLRGTADFSSGRVEMAVPKDQGNVVLSSTIGCDIMAIVPADSDKLPAGTILKGFLI